MGVTQRDKVLPSHVSIEKNLKKVGFFQPSHITPKYMTQIMDWDSNELIVPLHKRTARIYMKDVNKMQDSPYVRHHLGREWYV